MKLRDLAKRMHQGINTVADKVNYLEKGIPIIQSKNITKGYLDLSDVRYLSNEDKDKYSVKYNPRVGDLLVANIGTIGKSHVVEKDKDYLIAWNLFLIELDEVKVNSKYVKFFFDYTLKIKAFDRLLSGGTVKFINKKKMGGIDIPLVDLDIQNQIVEKLSKLGSIIVNRRKQLVEYDQLIKSRFAEMFGDPILNDKNLDLVNLKDLSVKILSGTTPKGGRQVYVDDGVMFFRSQNVWKNRIELKDIAYIDEQTHKKMSKSSLNYGDILMTKTGRINTENSSLGRAAMYTGEDDRANVNGHVYLIRMNDIAVKEFVLFIITTLEYRDYIRSVCVGGIDKRQLNKHHIEDLPIILPPRELQEEFVALLKQVDKLKFD